MALAGRRKGWPESGSGGEQGLLEEELRGWELVGAGEGLGSEPAPDDTGRLGPGTIEAEAEDGRERSEAVPEATSSWRRLREGVEDEVDERGAVQSRAICPKKRQRRHLMSRRHSGHGWPLLR